MTGRRISVRVDMRPPRLLDRVWYRRIGMTPPLAVGATFRAGRWARLVPYRFRRFHHGYAVSHGFFWLPCPLCGREFGGHEAGRAVPDPMNPPHGCLGVCAPCSRALPADEVSGG